MSQKHAKQPLEARLVHALLFSATTAGPGFPGFVNEMFGNVFADAIAYAKANPAYFEGIDIDFIANLTQVKA